jgi:UDP-glucose 4-epimerase
MIYGALPSNSSFLHEDQPLNANRNYEYTRDLVEIEAFCNGFRRQTPDLLLTILRFAHIVGPKSDTPLTRFLREEQAPALLGFDPMMQIIHEADVLAALVHAVVHDVPGVFNVAAEGVLPLWKLVGLAGKLPLPVFHPLAYLGVSLFGPNYAPIALDYLRYPCVADLTRMRTELGFVPQYTAEEALREFAAQQRLRQYLPESLAMAFEEERLRDTIERRRRTRAMQSASAAGRPRVHANGKRASKNGTSRRSPARRVDKRRASRRMSE